MPKTSAAKLASTKTWKHEHPDELRAWKSRYRHKHGAFTAPNRFRKWTQEEDRAVLAHSISDAELEVSLGRSIGAIQARRYKLVKRAQNAG